MRLVLGNLIGNLWVRPVTFETTQRSVLHDHSSHQALQVRCDLHAFSAVRRSIPARLGAPNAARTGGDTPCGGHAADRRSDERRGGRGVRPDARAGRPSGWNRRGAVTRLAFTWRSGRAPERAGRATQRTCRATQCSRCATLSTVRGTSERPRRATVSTACRTSERASRGAAEQAARGASQRSSRGAPERSPGRASQRASGRAAVGAAGRTSLVAHGPSGQPEGHASDAVATLDPEPPTPDPIPRAGDRASFARRDASDRSSDGADVRAAAGAPRPPRERTPVAQRPPCCEAAAPSDLSEQLARRPTLRFDFDQQQRPRSQRQR